MKYKKVTINLIIYVMNDKCFLKYYNKIIPKLYQQCQELGHLGELSFICISLGSPPQIAFLLFWILFVFISKEHLSRSYQL